MNPSPATPCYLRTVTGDIRITAPCVVLPHEHVQVGLSPAGEPRLDDRANSPEELVEALDVLAPLRRYDVRVVVDATAAGVGRRPSLIRTVSERLGIAFVVSTGLWKERGHPDWARGMDHDALAEMMITEIQEGIGGSGVRAGLIKVASGETMTPAEVEVFRAAALAQLRTGVTITTHTEGTVAIRQLEVLLEAGADPSRIIFGHLDVVASPGYHAELASAGSYIEFDRVGATHDIGDAARADMVVEAIKRGLANRILLSHDSHAIRTRNTEERRSFAALFESFIPRLRLEKDVPPEIIEEILTLNPLRALASPAPLPARAGYT